MLLAIHVKDFAAVENGVPQQVGERTIKNKQTNKQANKQNTQKRSKITHSPDTVHNMSVAQPTFRTYFCLEEVSK